jgi:hypothetical protein
MTHLEEVIDELSILLTGTISSLQAKKILITPWKPATNLHGLLNVLIMMN